MTHKFTITATITGVPYKRDRCHEVLTAVLDHGTVAEAILDALHDGIDDVDDDFGIELKVTSA